MNPFAKCYVRRKPIVSNIWEGVSGHYCRAFRDTWGGSNSAFNTMINQLKTIPQYRGIAASLSWVDFTDDNNGNYSFPKYSQLLAGIADANTVRTYPAAMMVYLTGRGFNNDDALEILPPNMQQLETVSGSTNDSQGAPIYRYLTNSAQTNPLLISSSTYNWRFFDPTIMARVKQMIDAFRVFIDNDPNGHLLKIVSTEESSFGAATVNYSLLAPGGGSQTSMEAGWENIAQYWGDKFNDRLVLENINYARPWVKTQMALLESRKWGYRAQNSSDDPGLIFNPASNTQPGALTYINGNAALPDGLTGRVAICLGVDNPDYKFGLALNTVNPRPPETIVSALAQYNPHIIVWQGSSFFTNTSPGGVQSVLNYLAGLPNDTKGAGGLNTNLPTNLL